jgi:hypothetical protein
MPTLNNRRYEAFAQARARGALLNDAYEGAGFMLHKCHPSRLAYRAEVAERIAELRALRTEVESHNPLALLAALKRIIKAGEGSENPVLVREARLAIVDAARLQADLAEQQARDQSKLESDFNSFRSANIKDTDPLSPLLAHLSSPPGTTPGTLGAASKGPPGSLQGASDLPRTSLPGPSRLPGATLGCAPPLAAGPGTPGSAVLAGPSPRSGATALTRVLGAPTLHTGSDGRAVALSLHGAGGGKSGLHGEKAAGNARRG